MSTETVDVQPSTTATQIIEAGEGPCLITNGSQLITAFLGDNNAIRATDPSTVIPLTPQNFVNVDGESDLFATVAPGSPSIPIYKLRGGIHASGSVITPLVGSNIVIGGQSITVPNGGIQQSTAFFGFTQPAYEIIIDAFQTVAGSTAGLEVQLQWIAEDGTTEVDLIDWSFWPGTSQGHVVISGRGPVRAGGMLLVFLNPSSGGAYQANFSIYQRSAYCTDDDWRHIKFDNANTSGINIAISKPWADFLGFQTASLATGTSFTTLLPLFSGLVQVNANTGSNTSDLTITIANSSDSTIGGGPGGAFFVGKSDANGMFSQLVAFPRGQTQIKLTNSNAATKSVNFWVTPVRRSP